MKKLLQILALLALTGLALPVQVSAADRHREDKRTETRSDSRKSRRKGHAADSVAKPTPYEKLFRDKRTESVRGGGMTLHSVEGKVYLELPDSLLNRALMISTTIERTGDPGDGIAGQHPVKPYMVEVYRGSSDTLIYLREYAPAVIVDGSPQMREAVGQNYTGAIVGAYAVKARTPDDRAAVIDLTKLFVGDEKRIRPIDPEGGNTYGGWMTATADYKKERSRLTGLAGGGRSVSVLSELSYETTVSFLGILEIFSDKPQSIVTRRTLTPLGPAETRMRLCDQRIGTTYRAVRRYSEHEQGSEPQYLTCRRALTDPTGALRPIVFQIDTTFDARTYAAIERGLLMWNDAFERIGFKEVIRVERMPADSDPGEELFSNRVRHTGTSNSEIHSAAWVDRRSGEILGSEILVPFNHAAAIRRQLLLSLSAVDPDVRSVRPSEERVAEALTALIARSAATTLGLTDNYAASAAYPTDSLRSPSFTRRYGLSGSITDDVYCNLVAQPGDKERGVKLIADALGPYDRMAVEWLYTPLPEARTPDGETAALDSLLARYEGDPACFFAHSGARSYDPRVGSDDLGSDLLRSVEYQLENLKQVAAHADEWLAADDADYNYRKELLTEMVQRINTLSEQVLRYVGGVYLAPAYEGSRQSVCTVVPKELQQRAVETALTMAEGLEWIDRQAISQELYDQIRPASYLQERILRKVLEKMGSLDFAVSKSDDPYTAARMAEDLTDHFRRAIASREAMPRQLCEMQQALLRSVISSAKVEEKKSSKSASFALTEELAGVLAGEAPRVVPARYEAAATDDAAEGLDEVAGAPYGYQAPQVTKPFQEHIYYGLLLQLKELYRRGIQTAPRADTRDFCRYMADRIDRSLKIE